MNRNMSNEEKREGEEPGSWEGGVVQAENRVERWTERPGKHIAAVALSSVRPETVDQSMRNLICCAAVTFISCPLVFLNISGL